ncbi:MAG: ThiJ/PfpI protein [Firmicutes bacterium]|nr:ThiJ/PfpI protein [Bacillota bacterium]
MKKILAVLSEYGYWGEELVGPLETFDQAGYTTVFATPKGKIPHALPPSMDASFVDPPLGRTVVSEEMAKKTRDIDSSGRLNNPENIEKMFPERPYLSSPNYLKEMESYYSLLEKAERGLDRYDALLIVGGSGPIVDMVNNRRVHDMILAFYKKDKPIAVECYGVTCLAFARDFNLFLGTDFVIGPPPYPLEYILRDAVGPNGQYHGNVGQRTSVIVDYPFISARSTACSYLCGQKLVEVLENGLRKYGW